ncbi:MAG TPA: MFS transporter [Chloroflexia bacterium]|nr:MFS transporter [Chloroflexia bacterium]
MKTEETSEISSAISNSKSFNLPVQTGLTFATFLLVGLNSGAFGVLLPQLTSFYGLDKASVSFFFWAGALGYLIAALSSGFLVAKLGLRAFLGSGLLIFGLASLMLCFKPPLALALIARLALGLGAAIMETGSNFFVSALPRNTTLFNYLHAFFGAGALFGPLVASFLLAIPWDWNTLFFFWLGFALLLIIGITVAFPQKVPSAPQEKTPSTHRKQPESRASSPMLQALKVPLVWLATFFLLIYVGVEMTLGLWSYTYLTDGQHFSGIVAGWLVSGYWLGLTMGRMILARLADKFGMDQRRLLLASIVGSIAGIALLWAVSNPFLLTFGLWFTGFCLGPIYPTTLAVLSDRIPQKLLSSTIAFVTSMSILGVAVFPAIAGNLAEGLGLGSLSPYILGQGLLMLVLWMPLLKPAARIQT